MNPSPSLLSYALSAAAAGLCVLPPREDGSKAPIVEWTKLQSTRPHLDRVREWYQGRRSGMGYVCGAVSGNLELFDFDDHDAYERYRTLARGIGLADLVDRIEAGYLEATPSGGMHWLYRCPTISGNTKLARRPKEPGEKSNPNDNVKVLIETRGEGGYVVTAPSAGRVHSSRKPYRLLAGGPSSIATITPEERAELWSLARSLDAMPVQQFREPSSARTASGPKPGDDYNARTSWADVLEPFGWVRVAEHGGETFWRRPGSENKWSASTNYSDNDLFYVFTTSTQFDAEKTYSKFAAYAILKHGGDFSAAARDLAVQGFGEQRAPRRLEAARAAPTPTSNGTERAPPIEPAKQAVRIVNAVDLLQSEFKPPRWAVPNLLMEGLSLLAGRPKLGKSWLALCLGTDVASGSAAFGKIQTLPGEVLYMALEDGERRMQERLNLVLGERVPPPLLYFAYDWPRFDMGSGGLALLAEWLDGHPLARLVVIDTFKRVRASEAGSQGKRLYDLDYDALAPLAALARQHGVAIIVVFHARKGEAEDPLDLVSGTTGLSGACDSVMVLRRERGQADASLFVTGRDIEERDMALRWHGDPSQRFWWEWIGEAEDYRVSAERRAIIDIVAEMPGCKPLDIAGALNKTVGSIRYLLYKMVKEEQVRLRGGQYFPVATPTTPINANAPTVPNPLSPPPSYRGVRGSSDISSDSDVSGGIHPCPDCGRDAASYSRLCPECHQRRSTQPDPNIELLEP